MKKIIGLLYALTITCAMARLGETLEQCQQRYGAEISPDKDIAENMHCEEVHAYRKDNITVDVGYVSGKAARIIFESPIGFTPKAAADIIMANRDSYVWEPITTSGDLHMKRSDGALATAILKRGNADVYSAIAFTKAGFTESKVTGVSAVPASY